MLTSENSRTVNALPLYRTFLIAYLAISSLRGGSVACALALDAGCNFVDINEKKEDVIRHLLQGGRWDSNPRP